MIGRLALGFCLSLPFMFGASVARAQDVPGIEICTAEKTMERRTSCLQSNVEFLQKTITKLVADHQQKLDVAKAQIEALKVNVAALQKAVDDLKAAQAKPADSAKKTDTPAAKDAAAKDAKDGAAKEGGK
jgi:esterase/lipase